MTFPDSIIQEAWKRAGGVCECKRFEHNHANYRCSNVISLSEQGKSNERGWDVHHVEKGAGDTLENCEILCWFCHKLSLEK